MKTSFLIFAFFMSAMTIAQDRKFGVNLGVQYNLPERAFNADLSDFASQRSGAGVYLMPKVNHTERLALGVNVGYNLVTENPTTDDIGMFKILSVVPTLQHELFQSNFTSHYSVGFGAYSVLNSETPLAPGLAIDLGVTFFYRYALSIDYQKILTKIEVDKSVIHGYNRWYYAGIRLSVEIWKG